MNMKPLISVSSLLLLCLQVNGAVTDDGICRRSVMCFMEAEAVTLDHPDAHFVPEDLDLTICTHVVYNRALISRGLDIVPRNATVDLQKDNGLGIMNRTVALKGRKHGLEVFIDVYDTYGELGRYVTARNRTALDTFTKNAVKFIRTHGFDGMNIRIFPGVPDEPPARGYDHFLPIIHDEFQRQGFKLMAFLMPREHANQVKFEMTEPISRHLDLIVVASYWTLPKEKTAIMSSPRAMERVIDGCKALGIPGQKLVVAVPAFSITMKLCDREQSDVNAPVCGEGDEGTHVPHSKLILHSSELMKKMRNTTEEWSITKDHESNMLFADSKSLLWASYEDYESIRRKAAFVLDRDLGGVAIINSNMEDFKGLYTGNGETFPIARNFYKAMNGD